MKKSLFSILLIALFLNQGKAQNIPFKIQKSEIFKDEFKDSYIVLSEENENGSVLIVRSYKGGKISPSPGFYFENYDTNLKLINEYDFQLKHPISHKTPIVLGVFKLEKNIKIIEMYYDINEKSYLCVANSININDFSTEKKELFRFGRDEVKELGGLSLKSSYYENANMKSLVNGSFDSSNEADLFSFSFSFNESEKKGSAEGNSKMALVLNKEKNTFSIVINFDKKGNSDALKIFLFDDHLNKIIDRNYEKNTKDRKHFLQNIELSKDGNSIYLLSKSYPTELKEKEIKYEFEVIKFTKDNVYSHSFDTQEHFIGSLKSIVKDDKLFYIGFYSDMYDKRYKGVSYFELNPIDLTVTKSKFNAFSEQFILDKYGKLKNKELKFLNFKNILITDKNELIFNAEESYITQTSGSYNQYAGYSSRQISHYDDVVSVKIDKDGNMLWSRNINKRQTGDNVDFFTSYTSTLVNDNVYFFINASDKIKNLDDNRIEFRDTRKNKYNLNLIKINQNGVFEYQQILDNEENEVPFMVANGIKSGNSMFFLGRKGEKKQLLKISL
ncbi:hypothetical protein [Flavobacterium polysaccharolyticum]|uniref:Uncharacterized protein n=1 Tax=Flavobacterium polysaccharolyticum TaxID=3133148 RepID=A0ABU9NLW3_9FLAO